MSPQAATATHPARPSTVTTPYRVVWFKRDLRLHDHTELAQAAARGPVLCLYVLEPSLWAQPNAAAQHLAFIHESLRDLHRALQARGGQLHLRVGEVTDVLAELHAQHPFEALHAHEETGNAHTFARDLAVGRWCRTHGVGWHEVPQSGVVRRLQNRNTWQPRWEALMAAPMTTLPPLSFLDPKRAPLKIAHEPGAHRTLPGHQENREGGNGRPAKQSR